MRYRRRVLVAVNCAGRYGRDAANGIFEYAEKHTQWEMQFDGMSNLPGSLHRMRRILREWRPHGVIGQILHGDFPAAIRRAGVAAVNISNLWSCPFSTVASENEATGRAVAGHLLDQKLQHFGFASRLRFSQDIAAQTFAKQIQSHGFECHIFRPSAVRIWEDSDYSRLRRWLRGLPRPIGIMATDDHRGREVIEACVSLKLRVPDDVAVIGAINDPLICSLCVPRLSSVDVPCRAIGFEAARMLQQIMSGKRPQTPVMLPPGEIIVRQSSDTLAVEDSDVASAVRFIREHACEGIDVTSVVNAVAISRRSLERRFLKELGRTPREEIIQTRVKRAKILLSESQMKVSHVGQACGFGRYMKFLRLFKQFTGMSPSVFRARALNHQ
jgi:LacI family transcriptional regulator